MSKLQPEFIVTAMHGAEFAIFHPESPSIIDAAMTAAEHWGDSGLRGTYAVRKAGDDRVHLVDLADVTDEDGGLADPEFDAALATIRAVLDRDGNYGDAYPDEYARYAVNNGLDPATVDEWAHHVAPMPNPAHTETESAR